MVIGKPNKTDNRSIEDIIADIRARTSKTREREDREIERQKQQRARSQTSTPATKETATTLAQPASKNGNSDTQTINPNKSSRFSKSRIGNISDVFNARNSYTGLTALAGANHHIEKSSLRSQISSFQTLTERDLPMLALINKRDPAMLGNSDPIISTEKKFKLLYTMYKHGISEAEKKEEFKDTVKALLRGDVKGRSFELDAFIDKLLQLKTIHKNVLSNDGQIEIEEPSVFDTLNFMIERFSNPVYKWLFTVMNDIMIETASREMRRPA